MIRLESTIWLLVCVAIPVALPLRSDDGSRTTNIVIGPAVLQRSVTRLGMNLGNRTYYDAGQITKNLVMRNPGFEGEIYQSTIRCGGGSTTTCVDDGGPSAWTADFWKGAEFEIFYGAARGRTGTIAKYTAATGKSGGTFSFAQSGIPPAKGDYMIVRMTVPGNAATGWWPKTQGSGTITTNFSDLPPGTTGRQTVAVDAPAASDAASLSSFFDGHAGRSFVLLHGAFRLSFKAKGIGGSRAIGVDLKRNGLATYLNQTVPLTGQWATYNLNFAATETGADLDSVAVQFTTIGQDSFYLDDVSLTQTDSDQSNTTAFRDPVVNALKTLKPGVLRFWSGQLGDSLDDLIVDPFGRQRAGYSAWHTEQEDISYGLPEFLQLCAAVGAEPWVVIPATFDTAEAAHLIEYLAGSPATPYGARRAAGGNPDPWTSLFTKIHLEFGNEAWNASFKGGAIEYPEVYGDRAQTIFAAMRRDSSYKAPAFDLVLGGQAVSPGRNQTIQNHCNNNDSFAVAPYLMNTVTSFASDEDLFGPAFAEPEAWVSPAGTAEGVSGGMMILDQQAVNASTHPVPVIVYETNFSTLGGTISQSALDGYVSSLGAGLAVADSMLHQMSHGVLLQNLWNLTQYDFARPDKRVAHLWGAVVDMGVTDRRRPQYLALQLANEAIGENAAMLQTVQQGMNPVWNQPLVNTVQLPAAHYVQSFAFSNDSGYSVVVFNLSRASRLPVTFTGEVVPTGTVMKAELTSASPADTNESSDVVRIVRQVIRNFDASVPISLPPCSMTTFAWAASGPANREN